MHFGFHLPCWYIKMHFLSSTWPMDGGSYVEPSQKVEFIWLQWQRCPITIVETKEMPNIGGTMDFEIIIIANTGGFGHSPIWPSNLQIHAIQQINGTPTCNFYMRKLKDDIIVELARKEQHILVWRWTQFNTTNEIWASWTVLWIFQDVYNACDDLTIVHLFEWRCGFRW